MPRNVRNFWIDLDVDGRNPISAGPKGAGGGFELNIKMRDEGSVKDALRVVGNITRDGTIELHVLPFDRQDFVIEGDNPQPLMRTRR